MADQLSEAGILLAVGMTVVFAFLSLLIGGIHSIAWFCRAFPSAEVAQSGPPRLPNNNSKISPTTTVSPQIKAAIQTAVNLHRHNKK